MGEYIRILTLSNNLEAGLVENVLEDMEIPFNIVSLHDLAYDGIYQSHMGWGYLEAPAEYEDKIKEIYQEIQKDIEEDNN
ncbi:MAG: hypothetical protein ACOCRZ_07635 [Halothermotrichaceae bacterium]